MKHIIYQVLPRLWGNGKMSDWDSRSLGYVKSLGADMIWFTGIPRHASGKSFVKGDPGSPYAIEDWFDVNPYLADDEDERISELERLISRTHKAGLKCITDFIPNHVSAAYDGPVGTYDYCDGDWTDTRKVDWSDPATIPAMTDALLFWAGKGVDGFRCDMVELVPPEAMAEVIARTKARFPDLFFIAEIYSRDNYRKYLDAVGFDYLYDKSGMYDILRGIIEHRSSARELTWNWQFLGDMQPRMLNFLENHDEQRITSPWFAMSADRTWAALAAALLFNTAPFMLYFGQEAGENAAEGHEGRTSIFNWCKPAAVGDICMMIYEEAPLNDNESLVLRKYREYLRLAAEDAFSCGMTWDLCYCNLNSKGFDADRHFAFLRFNESECFLVFCNFSEAEAQTTLVFPDDVKKYTSMDYIEVSAEPLDAVVISLNSTSASIGADMP